MKTKIKHLTKLISVLVIYGMLSCTSTKKSNPQKINFNINHQMLKNQKFFSGRLSKKKYQLLVHEIEKNLRTTFTPGSIILIYFFQKGPNCSLFNIKRQETMVYHFENQPFLFDEIKKEYPLSYYCVFAKDSYFNKFLSQYVDYIKDTGYFYNQIFTLHETCENYFLLLPNRKYLKTYGDDYYSYVSSFIKMNVVKEKK